MAWGINFRVSGSRSLDDTHVLVTSAHPQTQSPIQSQPQLGTVSEGAWRGVVPGASYLPQLTCPALPFSMSLHLSLLLFCQLLSILVIPVLPNCQAVENIK